MLVKTASLLLLLGGAGAWCPAPSAMLPSLRRPAFSANSPACRAPRVQRPHRGTVISMAKQVPRNVKESVDQLRDAIQAALSGRKSRMDIEFPYASSFGVDGEKKKSDAKIPLVTKGDGDASDRELARLVAEMFRGTALEETTVVAFSDAAQAGKAKKKWDVGRAEFKGQIIVLDAKQKKMKASGGGGFGAAPKEAPSAISAVPDGTEVLLIVGPQARQLKAIEQLASEVGQGCVIILVNARLDEIEYESPEQKNYFTAEFERVFFIKTAPLPTWSGGVLYRSYPDDWILGVPRKIGPPKALLTTARKPSMDEMDVALRGEQLDDVGTPDILKGFPNPFDMFK